MENKNNLETVLESTTAKEANICNYCYEEIKGSGYIDQATNNHYCNQTHYNADLADNEDEDPKDHEDCDD